MRGGVSSAAAVLRRLRWWDLEQVLPLERALFPADPWSAELFWSELGQGRSRHYVVAEVGEELVGYAGLAVPAPGGEGDVHTLAVAAGHQGRGVGSLLLADLLAAARRRGCPAVLLEVRADNSPARSLYARHGFEQLALRRAYYADGADAVVMRRRLAAAARVGA